MNHLNKVKAKLEQTLDELEDSLEREKKARADLDKNKRKVESDLKLAQEAVADLEKSKKDLESGLAKKEKEIASLNGKLEEEQALLARTQKQIKESQVGSRCHSKRFSFSRSSHRVVSLLFLVSSAKISDPLAAGACLPRASLHSEKGMLRLRPATPSRDTASCRREGGSCVA